MRALVNQWRSVVYEQLYELTEQTVHDTLLFFDTLASQAGIGNLVDNVQVVVVCSSTLSFPKYTTKIDRQILHNTVPYPRNTAQADQPIKPGMSDSSILLTASSGNTHQLTSRSSLGSSLGSITLLQSDTSYQEQYVSLLNCVLPYIASNSAYIISMAIAIVARLAMHVTQEQVLDVLTNLANALEIFISIGDNCLLPACIAVLAIENLCCGAIEPGDGLHAGSVLSLRALLQGLRASVKLSVLLDADNNGHQFFSENPIVDDRLTGLIFCQRLLSSAISRLIRSPQIGPLPRISDVNLLSAIASEIYSVFSLVQPLACGTDKKRQKFCDELAVTNIIQACRCNTIVQLFLRVPSYLSATLGLMTSLLLSSSSVRSARVANSCRGFLTLVLLSDIFLSLGQITDQDVQLVIASLRAELTDEAKATLKSVVESGYQTYLGNCGIPLRSARPLNIKAFG
ncbi:hypothetical protein GL50803_0011761 [Giardia duodenalis]|uniref:Uncharacterized protein n=1 Tax=Giardia intestinalis (strain ATCC 50803 / WB clone C6) TaxID=184922 RepID=D3KGM0_GIAIC|nr:hypothetical protein GL50803_0011761 [Giardia intestinalis]KAE8302398.1 hypothetical protein GL50803_0011761 [Giardia intestinalis]